MAKIRRCRACKQKNEIFIVVGINSFCDYSCAAKYGMAKSNTDKIKKAKVKKREFKLSDLKVRKDAAKKACHAYIRARDINQTCICCGKPLGDNYHAGHWLNSGNNPLLRYDEDNIHGQRLDCNFFKGGDSGDYEKNLRIKIGDDAVNLLLSKKSESIKRSASDYLVIEKYYKEKLKSLG